METKLNFAIICEHAFIDQGNRLTIIQTFNRIKAKNFPAIHPKITVVANYLSEKKDPDISLHHLVSILSPDGEKITELPIERQGIDLETQFISYFSGVPFKKVGKYKIRIELNKKFQKELPLEVIQES